MSRRRALPASASAWRSSPVTPFRMRAIASRRPFPSRSAVYASAVIAKPLGTRTPAPVSSL